MHERRTRLLTDDLMLNNPKPEPPLEEQGDGAFVRLDGARPTRIAGLSKRQQNLAVA